ncbi:MAG: MFS transporter, partial [Rhodospirillales bacterium]|nr:MFS transporter [Rhodospirillales bacterium]
MVIFALAFAAALAVTTEFITIGLLPVLAHEFGVSLGEAGWLVSAFALSAAIAGPVLTLYLTRWRTCNVLAVSLLVFGLGNVVAALFPNFTVMIGVRLVQGALLPPLFSLASSSAAALADKGRGGRAIGQVNFGTVIGAVGAVPAGVALAEQFGWRAIFFGLGILAAMAAALVMAALQRASASVMPPSQQAGILRRPRFLAHLTLSALLFGAMFASYSYIAAFLGSLLDISGSDLALALSVFGLAGFAGNWVASRAVDRGPTLLTLAVTVFLVGALALISLSGGHKVATLILIAVWGAAHTAAFVVCQVRVLFAAPDAPAFAASLNISVCNLGIAVGAALG